MLANAQAKTCLRAFLNPQVANPQKNPQAGGQSNRRFCYNRLHIIAVVAIIESAKVIFKVFSIR